MTIPEPQTITDAHGNPAFHAASSQRVGGHLLCNYLKAALLLEVELYLTRLFSKTHDYNFPSPRNQTFTDRAAVFYHGANTAIYQAA